MIRAAQLSLLCLRFITPVTVFLGFAAYPALSPADSIEGFTEPYRNIELAAGEPGVISRILVDEGDRVGVDQIIAALDSQVQSASLALATARSQAIGALRAAEAEVSLRQAQFEQLQSLRSRGHATQRELDRAQTDFGIAQARLQMAREELDQQRLECRRIEAQIERRTIRSPIRGIVRVVHRDIGEALLANDPRVVTVVQLDRLLAKYSLTPAQASYLEPDQEVQVSFPASGVTADARVESISPVIDAKSGTIEVTIVIENQDESLPSGARCLLHVDPNSHAGNTQYTGN